MARARSYRDWLYATIVTILIADGTATAMISRAAEDTAGAMPAKPAEYRLPDTTGLIEPPEQPIPFSHAHHVGTLTLACEFCHMGAGAESDKHTENDKHMTLPDTPVCMSCHVTEAVENPNIKKLAEHHARGESVPWNRVYKLLPGVNWAHKPHFEANISCQNCHGKVAELDIMTQTTAVTAMSSCVNCHRANEASTQCTVCHDWPAPEDFQRWSAGRPP